MSTGGKFMRMIISNHKGGTGKSTSATHIATALAESGEKILLVDADPQASVLRWSELAGDDWPASITVIAWNGRHVGKRIGEIADQYDHVIVDTAPAGFVELRSAGLVVDHLIIPTGARLADLDEIPGVVSVAAEISDLRPLSVTVLLTQVRTGTRSSVAARTMLADRYELPVFRTEIALRESIMLSHGSVPDPGQYRDVVEEMRTW